MTVAVQRAAVIDIGSARVKLLVGIREAGGKVSFVRFKAERGAAGELSEGLLPSETIDSVARHVNEMVATARSKRCEYLAIVATEVFRAARNGAAAIAEFERVASASIALLTAMDEAFLFRKAVIGRHRDDFFLLDVGGGSVQGTWGNEVGEFFSLPTGTFRLERDFQVSEPLREYDYLAMEAWIERQARDALPVGLKRDTLVVGSNCMEEFLRAALAASDGTEMARATAGSLPH